MAYPTMIDLPLYHFEEGIRTERPELLETFNKVKEELKEEAKRFDVSEVERNMISLFNNLSKTGIEEARTFLAFQHVLERKAMLMPAPEGLNLLALSAEAAKKAKSYIGTASKLKMLADTLEQFGLKEHENKFGCIFYAVIPLAALLIFKGK